MGSTGAGKSNLVAVVLEELSSGFPSARLLVVDPHGEYGEAAGRPARVIRTGAGDDEGKRLRVPYWALPFDDLIEMTMIGYAADDRELWVRFKSGDTYAYSDVPPGTYAEIMRADSKGSYFNREIKPNYPYRPV